MIMRRITSLVVFGLLSLTMAYAGAVPIVAVDLDGLNLGAKIVGPVGPEVETSLVNSQGDSLGDLAGSVSCPSGINPCVPPNNPPGTIYTYIHRVIPGVDLPNDNPPFAQPGTVIPFDDVTEFRLDFAASGFNGVAGYDFSEALVADITFEIEQLADNSLQWMLTAGSWNTGEAISFFWQTTQSPSGPGGSYSISNDADSGTGAGPLPTPVAAVPEPSTLALVLIAGSLVRVWRRGYE